MNLSDFEILKEKEMIVNQLEFAESILRSNPLKAYNIAKAIEENLSEESSSLLNCLYIEAKAAWSLGQFEEAIFKSTKMSEVGLVKKDNQACARAYNITGNVFYDLGNYEKSLENYMRGLSLARDIKDRKIESILTNNIGEIYNSIDAFDEALKYYLISLDIVKTIGDQSIVGVIYLNIGDLYYKRNNVEEAYEYVEMAFNHSIGIDDQIGIASAHFLLAKIYESEEKDDKAYQELFLAIEIMHRLHDKYNLVKSYTLMIKILIKEKKFEDALDYAEDGLDIASKLNIKKEISEIALLITEIYEETGEYRKSLDYYKMYSKTKLLYESERQEEQQKLVTAQISIEKAMHEKEIYRLKNIELRKKTDEIEKLYKDVSTINTIGQDVTSTLKIDKILYLLYENINRLMDASYFGIMLFDSLSGKISTELFLEYGELITSNVISIDDENSIGAWCLRNHEAVVVNDYENEYMKYKKTYSVNQLNTHRSKSIIFIPLIIRNEIIGAVTVQSVEKNAYKDYQFNMMKALASYISIAIKNSQESQSLALEIKERIKSQKKLEMLNTKLSEISYMDALTKIPNRRSFVDYLERELARHRRNSEQIAVLIIDIDFFKEYNDNYGHVEGDKCIALVASLLKESLRREIDFVARYGGDEFVAVLSNTDYAGVKKVSQKMIMNIKNEAIEHKFSKVADILTVTIGGISLVPKATDSMEMIIHLADNALYVAKDNGRNQSSFYNEKRES